MPKIPYYHQNQLAPSAVEPARADHTGDILANSILGTTTQVAGDLSQAHNAITQGLSHGATQAAAALQYNAMQTQYEARRKQHEADALRKAEQHAQNEADISAYNVGANGVHNDLVSGIKEAYMKDPDAAIENYRKQYPDFVKSQTDGIPNKEVRLGVTKYLNGKIEAADAELTNWASSQRTKNSEAARVVAAATVNQRISGFQGGDDGLRTLTEGLQNIDLLAKNAAITMDEDQGNKFILGLQRDASIKYMDRMIDQNPGQAADMLQKGYFNKPNMYLTPKGEVATLMPYEAMTPQQQRAFDAFSGGQKVLVPQLDGKDLTALQSRLTTRLNAVETTNRRIEHLEIVGNEQQITNIYQKGAFAQNPMDRDDAVAQLRSLATQYGESGQLENQKQAINRAMALETNKTESEKTQIEKDKLAAQERQTEQMRRSNESYERTLERNAREDERLAIQAKRATPESLAIQQKASSAFSLAQLNTKDPGAHAAQISEALKLNNAAHEQGHITDNVWVDRTAALAAKQQKALGSLKQPPTGLPGAVHDLTANNAARYYDAMATGVSTDFLKSRQAAGDPNRTAAYNSTYWNLLSDGVTEFKRQNAGALPDQKQLEVLKALAEHKLK